MTTADHAGTPDPFAARREQILDAATTVFAAKGFHRATIKEVARAAGVADGAAHRGEGGAGRERGPRLSALPQCRRNDNTSVHGRRLHRAALLPPGAVAAQPGAEAPEGDTARAPRHPGPDDDRRRGRTGGQIRVYFFVSASAFIQYAFDPMYPLVSGMFARTIRRISRMSIFPSCL